MSRYEQLEQQGEGSKEAVKYLPKSMQKAAQRDSNIEDKMTTVDPSDEGADWKRGIELTKYARRSHELMDMDLMKKLRQAQMTAVQGTMRKEFNGLGDNDNAQAYTQAAVGVGTKLLKAFTGSQQEEQRRQEEKKQLPIILITGSLALVLLTYLLFFR